MSEVIKYSQQHVWKSVAELKAEGKKVDWDRVFSGKSIPTLLGLGPCYHMSEVIMQSQQHVWKSVADL